MGKVKNVLSIDMDYIMGSCIQLYNDCAGSDEFKGGDFWEKVNRIKGLDPFLKYDEEKYLYLVDLFSRQLAKLPAERFFFAKEHDMILEFLCGDPQKAGEIYNIYNIDHHHDLYYNPQQKEHVDRFDFACLADWVYYLGKNEKIEKYYWLRNETSQPFPEGEISCLTFPCDFDGLYEAPEKLSEVEFDYVFLCRSAEYFPEKFNHLFDAFLLMARAIKQQDYTVWTMPYCRDDKSRPIQF